MTDIKKVDQNLAKARNTAGARYLFLQTRTGVLFEVLPPQDKAKLATKANSHKGVTAGFGGALSFDGKAWVFQLDWKKGSASIKGSEAKLKKLKTGDTGKGIAKIARLASAPLRVVDPSPGVDAEAPAAPA